MPVQDLITSTATHYGVPPALALAVAQTESNFNQQARGSSGEVGLFQLMPATAAELGVNPFNLGDNIDGGIRYLRQQFDRFGSWDLALGAYNAGPGNVSQGFLPTGYIDRVVTAMERFIGVGEGPTRIEAGVPTFAVTATSTPLDGSETFAGDYVWVALALLLGSFAYLVLRK